MGRRKQKEVNVIVEYTEGYQQRFTMAIIKLWETIQKREMLNKLNGEEQNIRLED